MNNIFQVHKNIIAAIELAEAYENVALEILEEKFTNIDNSGRAIAKELFGFGNKETCTICQSVNENCKACLYASVLNDGEEPWLACTEDPNKETYNAIRLSYDAESLNAALKERAKYIRSLVADLRK